MSIDNEINQVSMKIILHAGDAREVVKKALQNIEEANFDNASELLQKANEEIKLAHQAQTEVIQGEARGEEKEFSLLFAHAQDTLMTIKSEWNIAEQLIRLFKVYDSRLKQLENK